MIKASPGRYFEDFRLGDTIEHATPRTITSGDVALYQALYGARFAPQSSAPFAKSLGLKDAPVDDLLVFHIVFGKTVTDISINAVANLGYAEGRFLRPVFVGDTLNAISEVIGLKENSNHRSGILYVRTRGLDENGECILSFVRWVMVNKRSEASPAPEPFLPQLAESLSPEDLAAPTANFGKYGFKVAGAPYRWGDYAVGDKIDHIDGQTIEESEHQLATRLYQNTAKVHFNAHMQAQSRFGKRLVYGGHIISMARALSFNGLENAVHIVGLNAGAHVAPAFAGDTVYAWSEVVEKVEAPGRNDAGFIRLRTVALKNRSAASFPYKDGSGTYDAEVILDLDIWAAMPR